MRKLIYALIFLVFSVFCEERSTDISQQNYYIYFYNISDSAFIGINGSWVPILCGLALNSHNFENGLQTIFSKQEKFSIKSTLAIADLILYQPEIIKISFLRTIFYQTVLQSGFMKIMDYFSLNNKDSYTVAFVFLSSLLSPSTTALIISHPYKVAYIYAISYTMANIYSEYGFVSVLSCRMFGNLLVINLMYILSHLYLRPDDS